MKISQLILENRIDDFNRKYGSKYTPEQASRIIAGVPLKYLDWVGKTFDNINFDNNLPILISTLNKFDRLGVNLPNTDINAYKALGQMVQAIKDYEERPRRDYKQMQGGNVVFDDGKHFVVNPTTHESSCYYGRGTKWCTAANSDYQFKQYNDDGKLFYILDRTKATDDPLYKIAVLRKFNGENTFFDAIDERINSPESLNNYKEIMTAINDYMNQEYAAQIKIYTDRELAKKEKDRLERLRQQRILDDRRSESEERRLEGEWELGPDCPLEGLKAHALLDWLVDTSDVEVLTNEDRIEIQRLTDEIERLNTEYDNSEDVNSTLLDDISDLEDEREELERKITVYNLIPTGDHYEMTEFEVIDSPDLEGRRYMVGTEYETEESAKQYVEQLIDDIGYEGFSESFVRNYIDEDAIYDRAYDYYDDDVNANPELYLDESDRQLSRKQDDEIDVLNMRIKQTQAHIEKLENLMDGENDEEIEEKVDELIDLITDYETEIEEIKDSPDGDFPDDLIEDKVTDMANDAKRNPDSFLENFGLQWEEFIDKDDFVKAVVDEDGYGHTLNHYDGTSDEVTIQGQLFYVMRID